MFSIKSTYSSLLKAQLKVLIIIQDFAIMALLG